MRILLLRRGVFQDSGHRPRVSDLMALELQVTMDLLADKPCAISLTPDTASERNYLPSIDALQNTLFLVDRGYFELKWFQQLNHQGGFFIARCMSNVNPVVESGWREDGRPLKSVKWKKLKAIQGKLFKRQRSELEVRWQLNKTQSLKARLICFWNAQEKRYTWLMTNLPKDSYSLEQVSEAYRLRWQIELLFKEWKSYTNLHRFDTGNEFVAEGLIWASIAAAILKRFISNSSQKITGHTLSTRKVAMSCSFEFTQMMVNLMNGGKKGGRSQA